MPYSPTAEPQAAAPPNGRSRLGRWLPALWLVAVGLTVYFLVAHWHAAPALRPAPDLLSGYVPEQALWLEDRRAVAQGEPANSLYQRHAAGSLIIPDAVWILTLLLYLIPVVYVLRRGFSKGDAPPSWNLALTLAGPLVVVLMGGVEDNTRASAALVFILGLTYGAIVGQRDVKTIRFLPGEFRAWSNALLFAAVVIALLLAYRLLVQPDHPLRWPGPEKVARYAAWALFQQWLINRVLAREALRLTSGNRELAAAIVAVLFGMLHAPNFALMCATCIGAFVWTQLYFRRPYVLPLAVCHVILSVALVALTPPWVVRNAEIGARFFMPAL